MDLGYVQSHLYPKKCWYSRFGQNLVSCPPLQSSDAVPRPCLRSLRHRYHLHDECSFSTRKCQMRFQCSEEKMQLEIKSEGLSTQAGGSAGALCGWVTSPALSCCTSLAPLSNPLLCANLQPCWLHLCTYDLMWSEIPQQPWFSSDPSYGRNLR